jgi:hypothetical protein
MCAPSLRDGHRGYGAGTGRWRRRPLLRGRCAAPRGGDADERVRARRGLLLGQRCPCVDRHRTEGPAPSTAPWTTPAPPAPTRCPLARAPTTCATPRPLAEKALAPSREAVISVPDGETTAALGFTQASRLPLELELIRSHYAGRTFIVPARSTPQAGVTLKLSPVASVIKGRSGGRGGGGRRQPRAQSGPERSSTCCARQGSVKCTCVASPHRRPMRAFTASIRRRTPN